MIFYFTFSGFFHIGILVAGCGIGLAIGSRGKSRETFKGFPRKNSVLPV